MDDRLIVFPLALLFIAAAVSGAWFYGALSWLGIFPSVTTPWAADMRVMNAELRELVRDMLK